LHLLENKFLRRTEISVPKSFLKGYARFWMRRFAVTIFALLYVSLIFSLSAQRMNIWATYAGEVIADAAGHQNAPGVGKTPQTDAHVSQTKLVEAQFVMESPRECGDAPPVYLERHIFQSSVGYTSRSMDELFSSRAPPSLS
jgi:hypothetical protein